MKVDIPDRLVDKISLLAGHGLYGRSADDVINYAITRFLDDLVRSRAMRVALMVATGEVPAEPGGYSNRKNGWSAEEDRILRENYQALASPGCAPFLPGRSPLAIRVRARRLGLATPRANIAARAAPQAGTVPREQAHAVFPSRVWCDQCEQRVAAPCQSPFSKVA